MSITTARTAFGKCLKKGSTRNGLECLLCQKTRFETSFPPKGMFWRCLSRRKRSLPGRTSFGYLSFLDAVLQIKDVTESKSISKTRLKAICFTIAVHWKLFNYYYSSTHSTFESVKLWESEKIHWTFVNIAPLNFFTPIWISEIVWESVKSVKIH